LAPGATLGKGIVVAADDGSALRDLLALLDRFDF